MDNNNNNELEKNLEKLFEDDTADDSYSYEQQRKGYSRSNSMRKEKYRRNKIKKVVLITLLAVLLLALWFWAAFAIVWNVLYSDTAPADTDSIGIGSNDTGDNDTSADTSNDPGNSNDKTDNSIIYTTVTMSQNAYKVGSLILINSTYKYDYTADTFLTRDLVSIRNYGNDAFSVPYNTDKLRIDTVMALNKMFAAFKAETGLSGYSIRPDYAYCTPTDQQRWYESAVNKHGESAAASIEFKSGESEHEAGRTFDIKVEQNGSAVFIKNADEEYQWIYNNCYKYGFILRYPSEKSSVTGINMASTSVHKDHFRHIGVAPAYVMYQNNWCLEEFLVEIEKYRYDGEHLNVTTEEGTSYEMYYYPATTGGETEVKVPENLEYEISGNNIDGYIVIVTTKTAEANG